MNSAKVIVSYDVLTQVSNKQSQSFKCAKQNLSFFSHSCSTPTKGGHKIQQLVITTSLNHLYFGMYSVAIKISMSVSSKYFWLTQICGLTFLSPVRAIHTGHVHAICSQKSPQWPELTWPQKCEGSQHFRGLGGRGCLLIRKSKRQKSNADEIYLNNVPATSGWWH